MRKRHVFAMALTALAFASATWAAPGTDAPAAPATRPAYWTFAPTPPMGWNSYDAFGDSVTEAEVMSNAQFIKDRLLSHGWQYVVVDYRWYDPGAHDNQPKKRAGADLAMDDHGRLLPAPNRFPSAEGGKGFKPLADKVHEMGLKFGIHVMRGIPRQAVKADAPVDGSDFRASQAADPKSTCGWCPDMFGVDATQPAGRAYYASICRLYADWGVDFIKVDDLSRPYSAAEVEAIRDGIDKTGRAIVFSTSPGETPLNHAEHVMTHANLWRVSEDFWDEWKALDHAFDLREKWAPFTGAGHWPDSDMIPFGRIGVRSVGKPRITHFTKDEQVTLMSLWALAPSPLMLGGDLPQNDEWDNSLLTNDDVLAIDQDPDAAPAVRVAKDGGVEVWVRDLHGGDFHGGGKAVGLFNRGPTEAQATAKWDDAKLVGRQKVRDLWQAKDLGTMEGELTLPVPKHGAVLVKMIKE